MQRFVLLLTTVRSWSDLHRSPDTQVKCCPGVTRCCDDITWAKLRRFVGNYVRNAWCPISSLWRKTERQKHSSACHSVATQQFVFSNVKTSARRHSSFSTTYPSLNFFNFCLNLRQNPITSLAYLRTDLSGVIRLQNPKLCVASESDAPSTLHPSLVCDGRVSIADTRAVCLHRWTVSWCSFGKSKEHVL